MSSEYGISFLKEKCVQCHGCEIACKSWRGVASGVRWRRVDNIWHGTYPNVTSMSASIGCMHCADPGCIKVCPEDAIKKRAQDGIVVVDRLNGDRLGPQLRVGKLQNRQFCHNSFEVIPPFIRVKFYENDLNV